MPIILIMLVASALTAATTPAANADPRLPQSATSLESTTSTCTITYVYENASLWARTSDDSCRVVFENVRSEKCLDVQGASTANGTPLIQYTCLPDALHQEFGLIPTNSAHTRFTLRPRHSGKCLDVQGSSTANSTPIIQYTCYSTLNQQWGIHVEYIDGDFRGLDYFSLRVRHSGKCADVSHASLDNGAAVVQYDCRSIDNQQFHMDPILGGLIIWP